jgi:hypothetical protein
MQDKFLKVVYFFVFILLFFIRIYGLNQIGLAEYDSVFNFQVIQAMDKGNWQQLFQHGSPTFFIFFYLFYQVFPSYLFLEYVNCLVSIIALAYCIRILAQAAQYDLFKEILLLFFAGFSVFLVYSTRSFAIESLSLWCFVILFKQLLLNYTDKKDIFFTKNYYLFWWIFAIFLTINYKIVLLLPFFFLLVIFKIHYYFGFKKIISFLYHQTTYLLKIIAILLVPFILYTFVGVFIGLKWTSYIGHWVYVLVLRKNLNPWKATYTFHTDIDFYFQYLIQYEDVVLLVGIITAIYYGYQFITNFKRKFLKNNIFFIASLFVIFTFVTMSFLPKAPRALLFIFPFLYFLSFHFFVVFFTKFIQKKLLQYAILVFTLGNVVLQYHYLHEYIYRYTKTSYSLITKYLQANKIEKIAVTVSLNIYPFLPPSIKAKQILHPKELTQLQAKGYEYCLLDDFTKIVGAVGFEDLINTYTVVLSLPEPTLLAPIVYFEHCEFNNYTFKEAQKVQQKMSTQTNHLTLIRLSKE